MRIPTDLLEPYPNGKDRFAGTPGTRPVAGSAPLASDLPEGLPKPRQTPEAAPEYDSDAAHRSRDGENDTPQERRHDDRRRKNVPTTLDTRLTQARRRSTEPAPINIEI